MRQFSFFEVATPFHRAIRVVDAHSILSLYSNIELCRLLGCSAVASALKGRVYQLRGMPMMTTWPARSPAVSFADDG